MEVPQGAENLEEREEDDAKDLEENEDKENVVADKERDEIEEIEELMRIEEGGGGGKEEVVEPSEHGLLWERSGRTLFFQSSPSPKHSIFALSEYSHNAKMEYTQSIPF